MSKGLWDKYEKHVRNEGLSLNRIKKLRTMFNLVNKYVDMSKAKRDIIEDFIHKLNANTYKRTNGSSYSGSTKQDVKKFLRQFFKWYKGDNEYYPKEVSWIKARIPKDERPAEKPIVEIHEAVKLSKMFKKYDNEILTLLLFDSGFRIQEMMSVKKKDLTWEPFDDDKSCWWIKCNVSKTFPRKIPIPLFTEVISSFAQSESFRAKADSDDLLDFSYKKYSENIKKFSLKLFDKPITCHCLRHSSATYYAKDYAGNVPVLAQRFGWGFDAKELKTYVRMSGAFNKAGAKVSHQNAVVKLKAELEKEREDRQKTERVLKQQTKHIQEQMRNLISIMKATIEPKADKNTVKKLFDAF
jgi:integrase